MLNMIGISGIFLGLILQSSYPPAFPRANTKKVLETERFIVWDAVWPEGQPTVMHLHDHNAVSVTVEEGSTTATTPDGVTTAPTLNKVGDFLYRAKGVVHSEVGVSAKPRHAIVVELKDARIDPLTTNTNLPQAFPREGAKLSLENERVLVWDYTFQPGKPSPMHFHDKDTVAIFLGTGRIKSQSPSGTRTVQNVKVGSVLYSPRGRTHSEVAEQGAPRAIVIELK